MMSTYINKSQWLLICVLTLSSAVAQAADNMPGMDMNNPKQAADSTTTTDHSTMDHSTMDHSTMDMSTTSDSGTMDMNMDMPGMQMQGGSAPPDARDPHAYSDGQTLTSGDYVLPGPRLLHMADEHNFAGILVDRLERVDTSGPNSTAYDLMAWYGRDYNKLVVKSEGDVFSGTLEESQTDVLWSHAIADYWDAQLGMRYD
ncbi:MAG: copper resistance protein B, partial [Thermoanaerobaculia bacterium]